MRSAVFNPPMNCLRVVGRLFLSTLLLLYSTFATAQEITNFKFTGYEASVSTNVQSDKTNTVTPIANSADVTTSSQNQTDVRFETSLMTHSYVYHPKFLSLDMGLGVISSDNNIQTDGVNVRTREPLYNYSLHGSVLPEKPLHGTFFFDRVNSTPTVGTGENLNQINDKYGFTTTVMSPLLPMSMLLDVTREENKGEGSQRILDEKIDRVGLSARKDIGRYGATDVRYSSVKQNSNNGVSGQSGQSTTQDSQSISADTRLKLGTTTHYDLNNRIEYTTQTYNLTQGSTQEQQDARFGLDYRGYHAANLNSFAYYQANRTTRELSSDSSHSVSGGATWAVTKDFDLTGGARAGNSFSSSAANQVSNRSTGLDATARYARSLAIGTGTVDYSVRYDNFDQTSSGDPITPVDREEVVMKRQPGAGDQPVKLVHPNVVSIGTVQLKNSPQTLFVPGVDYFTQVSRTYTTIYFDSRLFDILGFKEGDIVLVTYTYDNGGTYGSAQVNQSLGFTWTLSPQFDMFARYADSSPKIISGNPSTPLNQIKSLWYGLRATMPLVVRYDLVLNANLDQEDRRETYLAGPPGTNFSYVRTSGDFYLRGELPTDFSNDYRAGLRRVRLAADDPSQSLDQTAYEFAFGWRTSNGLNLTASALVERDSDYLIERNRKSLSLRALWRYRRFYASADLVRSHETQAMYARDRTVGRLTLRRDL